MARAPAEQREHRRDRRARRARSIEAASVAGLAYAVLNTAAFVRLSRYPSLSLSDEELTAWFDDTGNQSWLIGALSIASVASFAFLWFVAVFRRRIGDREDKFFATVFLGSGLVYVTVWLTGFAALAAPAVAMVQLDAAAATPGSVSLAGGIGGSLLLVVAPRIQAVFIFTTSTVIMRSRVLPTWLAIVGYVSGLALFLIPMITEPAGYLFPAWVLIVSVVLLVDRPQDLMIDEPADTAD